MNRQDNETNLTNEPPEGRNNMHDENTHPKDFSQDPFEIELPEISDVPPAIEGSGGDDHTNNVALLIARATPDFQQAWEWLKTWNKICRPEWQEYRLKQKLESAWNYVYPDELIVAPEEEERPRARRRKVSFKRLNEIALTGKGKYDELISFVKDKKIPPLEEVIDQMYPGNPFICRARKSQSWARTDTRESIRGVEHMFEWIVPSPMSKQTGFARTTGKSDSHRCRDNAGPWRYMVIEFDFTAEFQEHINAWAAQGISTRDVQAKLILWLGSEGEPRQWPFMIVDSGNKSLHAWYAIHDGFPEEAAMDLLSRAIPLGADKGADQPEHFFRFPGGTRASGKGQPQPIIYYDRTKLV